MGFAIFCKENSPIFTTKSGPVRGKVFNFDNRKYYGFLGIPYAEPPVGDLRFKKPLKVHSWSKVRDCFKFGPRCPQKIQKVEKLYRNVSMSEAHCLTLNVFCPSSISTSSNSGHAVMVFIHGGGFSVHSSSKYGDSNMTRNLCSKGVVVVSINYRLGVFGFFTTGDAECPGNMGLWDQTLALKWVKDNIGQFGGDHDNITVFGHSSGAHSADLLSLSPHSRDLFHRVIAMSGSSTCTGAIFTKEGMAKISRNFARELGWLGLDRDTKGLMAFMSNQPSAKLINNLTPIFSTTGIATVSAIFVPNAEEDFFPTGIVTLRENSPKKEYLMGTTACEGLMLNSVMDCPFTIEGLRQRIRIFFKGIGAELEDALVKFYTEGVDPKDHIEMAKRHDLLTGDFLVNNGVLLNAIGLAILGRTVFFYNFEYYSPQNFGLYNFVFSYLAATYSFDIRYVLGKGVVSKFRPNDEDLKVLDQMTTWFTNFAKHGDPNEPKGKVVWEKYDFKKPYRHFNINHPSSEMKEDYQKQRLRQWVEFQVKLDPTIAELFKSNPKESFQGENGNSPGRGRLLI